MEQKIITETVHVNVNTSPGDITQVVIGNSLPIFTKLIERYEKSKEFYESQGYTITSEDIDKLSFQAEITYTE